MSHEIDMSNDRENMAYVGEVPWHGLGSQLQQGASLDEWRIAAGLDWTVQRADVLYAVPSSNGAPQMMEVPKRSVLYRSDTHAPLGILTKDRYHVVQPNEVLEFFQEFLEAGSLHMETAGSLAGGKRIWALARTGDEADIKGDKLLSYLLLATSMDGSLATTAKFTSVRVVCQNTLSMADRERGQAIRIRHSRQFDPKQVKRELGIGHELWSSFASKVETLAQRQVSQEDTQLWLTRVLGDPSKQWGDQPAQRLMRQVMHAVETSPGADLPSAAGTAWGLVNGMTYFIDHQRGRSVDTRMDSAWFGYGAMLKQKALDEALALAA